MPTPLVLAVDPGGQRTGIVLRRGDTLGGWHLIERGNEPTVDWADTVVGYVTEAAADWQPDIIAVEGVNDPTPHLGIIQITWLLHTAIVIGHIRGAHPSTVIIPPGGFTRTATQPKQVLQQIFPAQLISTPIDRLKDVRAAWLIAEAAARHARAAAVSG